MSTKGRKFLFEPFLFELDFVGYLLITAVVSRFYLYLNCFMIWLDDFNYKLVKDIVGNILEWFPKPKRVNVIGGATVGRLGAFAPLTVLKVSHSIHKFLEILKIRPSEIFPKIQVFPLPLTRNTICLWLVKVPWWNQVTIRLTWTNDDGIFSFRSVLAAKSLGDAAYNNFLDHTFLGDRKTTIREYLATTGSGIMEEEPPEPLKTRYGGWRWQVHRAA